MFSRLISTFLIMVMVILSSLPGQAQSVVATRAMAAEGSMKLSTLLAANVAKRSDSPLFTAADAERDRKTEDAAARRRVSSSNRKWIWIGVGAAVATGIGIFLATRDDKDPGHVCIAIYPPPPGC